MSIAGLLGCEKGGSTLIGQHDIATLSAGPCPVTETGVSRNRPHVTSRQTSVPTSSAHDRTPMDPLTLSGERLCPSLTRPVLHCLTAGGSNSSARFRADSHLNAAAADRRVSTPSTPVSTFRCNRDQWDELLPFKAFLIPMELRSVVANPPPTPTREHVADPIACKLGEATQQTTAG